MPKSGSVTSASRAAVILCVPPSSLGRDPRLGRRRAALDRGERVRPELQPRPRLPVRPPHPDLGAVGPAEPDVDPPELTPGATPANRDLALDRPLAHPDLD